MTADMATDSGPRYEPRDANAGSLVAIAVGLCVVIALTFLFSWTLLGYVVPRPPAGAKAASAREPAGPRLQTDPALDLSKKRAAEDAALHSYGWVNRSTNTVRIPIDRAMDLLVDRASQPPAGSVR